jgi:hypothetical protein
MFAEMQDPLLGPLREPLLDPVLDPSYVSGSEPAPDAADESGWAGEWVSGDWSLATPQAEPATDRAEPPPRPAPVTRLTDADRELLARLQSGPRVIRRGTNGSGAPGR